MAGMAEAGVKVVEVVEMEAMMKMKTRFCRSRR
jgi:hypothetical protein